MPKLLLSLHPDSQSPAKRIEVDIARATPGELSVTYAIFGELGHMAIPSARSAARADELWKHSCFEVFLRAARGYYEFNFAPSSQWAAYRFDGYREGMRDAASEAPAITWNRDGEVATLTATLRLPPDVKGPLGLSAIIEDSGGDRSFWALAHPPGDPDFHDAACFAAQLPPAE